MNRYDAETALPTRQALSPYRPAWFEDICDPLDFELQATLARSYAPAIAAGEALFSAAKARNLIAARWHRREVLRPGLGGRYGVT
jgi:L-alanine-DL-glutamate epimerase-like enolase superfamily enzyme